MKLQQRIAQLERRRSGMRVSSFVGHVDDLVRDLLCSEQVSPEQFRAHLQQAVSLSTSQRAAR